MEISKEMADVWVVAGAPGSGKTIISSLLLKRLNPHPALLDKDTIYNSFVSSILEQAGKPNSEREGDWYDEHIKIHEYSGMTATAREIRSYGCPVLLSAPFTNQIHHADKWQEWVEQLGGGRVHLVWIKTDKETLKRRLELRASEKDAQKLLNFDKFVDYMKIDSPPPVEHIVIDNRITATETLEVQIEKIVQDIHKVL
jgi:predicted kinase